MPTPRMHGGAGIAHFPMVVPGYKGLNTQQRGSLLGPEWATRLENTVIDVSGRVGARKGWNKDTTVAASAAFKSGIEYRKQDGTTQLFLTSATKAWSSADNGGTFSDVTGTAAFTSGVWHLVNFNDFVIGFQQDEKALIYNGTTCSQVADGDAPTGAVGCAAFGRIWQCSADGTVLQWSSLLDHTAWAPGDVLDLTSVWPDNDTIKGITAFNNLLVIFGARNILVFGDDTGSVVGISPTNMRIVDTIPGIGLLHQKTMQHVNGDLWFMANNRSIYSFNRLVVEQKSGSLTRLSLNVSDTLKDAYDNGSFQANDICSGFSPRDRFYLLSLPTESSPGVSSDEVGQCFAFDTRDTLDDGSARVIGIWNQMVPTVYIQRANGDWVSALRTKSGKLGRYLSQNDDTDSFRLIYESGWLDITGQGYELILKRINGLFFFDVSTLVQIKWAFDFRTIFNSQQLTFTIPGGSGLWGSGEWGIAEWGGGIDLVDQHIPGKGTGEYIKVGAEVIIDGGTFSIQKLDLLAKVGRLKG